MSIAPKLDPTDAEYWPFSDEEDDLPLSPFHVDLAEYLTAVLTELFRQHEWYIGRELAIYAPNMRRNSLAPDVAAFIGVRVQKPYTFTSWFIGSDFPPPRAVFEIASPTTWEEDFNKLPLYAAWGIEEVYIYDPGIPRVWPAYYVGRLRGYRNENGTMTEMPPNAQGRIWSAALDSWLVPDEDMLRLYDANGQQRLTGEETERYRAAAEHQARMEERAARLIAQRQRRAERAARQQAEARAEAERIALADLRAKLLAKGINPDEL